MCNIVVLSTFFLKLACFDCKAISRFVAQVVVKTLAIAIFRGTKVMSGTCSSCGGYFSGWKCTNCEQTELMKKSIQQQQDLAEKNKRAADYEARMNREMQEEQAERAAMQAQVAQMEAGLESTAKQMFAEIALLIQTNTTETIGNKVEGFFKQVNSMLDVETYEKTGGILTPKCSKYFRNYFTDYILSNGGKAAEIAIAKEIFESHAKTALEIWQANEAQEEKRKLQQAQLENEEQLARDEVNAIAAADDKQQRRHAMYGCYFFIVLLGLVSYIEFQESKNFVGFLCAIGAFGFFGMAMYLSLDNTSRLK